MHLGSVNRGAIPSGLTDRARECPICRSAKASESELQAYFGRQSIAVDDLITTRCGHVFHYACILRLWDAKTSKRVLDPQRPEKIWPITIPASIGALSCPVCRGKRSWIRLFGSADNANGSSQQSADASGSETEGAPAAGPSRGLLADMRVDLMNARQARDGAVAKLAQLKGQTTADGDELQRLRRQVVVDTKALRDAKERRAALHATIASLERRVAAAEDCYQPLKRSEDELKACVMIGKNALWLKMTAAKSRT
jgi:hypothetical protein